MFLNAALDTRTELTLAAFRHPLLSFTSCYDAAS